MNKKCIDCENRSLCFKNLPICKDVRDEVLGYNQKLYEATIDYLVERINKNLEDKEKLTRVKAVALGFEYMQKQRNGN